jgi:hypothetical protein
MFLLYLTGCGCPLDWSDINFFSSSYFKASSLSSFIIAPKCSAKATAASFPLGSINPWSMSHTFIQSPLRNSADVPDVLAAFSETSISSFLSSI